MAGLHRTASAPIIPEHAALKSTQSNGISKKRPSRAGTRSVSTLTAAQLERKRANDREAQRAIRQRTKDHIESLERRIAELTSNNDLGAKLVQAMERGDDLEQENIALRSRLNQAIAALSESGGTYLFLQSSFLCSGWLQAPYCVRRCAIGFAGAALA